MKAFKQLVPALILLGTVTAIAQPDPAPAPGTDPAPAAAPAATPPPAAPALSVSEMRLRSETIQTQIQEDYKYVLGLRERVRKQKDVIKLDCVNDRLIQLKAQMNIADKANQSLQSSFEREPATSPDLFSQLERSGNGVKELRESATQCVGEPELYKQDSGLDVTKPDDLVDDPGILDPYNPEGAQVEPPGYASAFR